MVDAHYTEPRLVALYVEDNAGTWDTDFYAGRLGTEPLRIADVGSRPGRWKWNGHCWR